MKLAVVGAGSTYTPELVSGLSRLAVDEFVLHDIDAERREVVGAMARRMLDRQGYQGRLEITDGDAASLLEKLRHRPAVRDATIFGQAVHALVDADRTNEELGLAGLKVREAEANLEDVFVTLSRLRQAS